jgi:peptide/nickel transport system substrate-binding protein
MRAYLYAALFCAAAASAHAQNALTIAAQSVPTAMDPHFHRANSNNALLRQVFDPIVLAHHRRQDMGIPPT